jgi:hypothetical protein
LRVGEPEADSTLSNALSLSRLFALRRDEAIREVRNVALIIEPRSAAPPTQSPPSTKFTMRPRT